MDKHRITKEIKTLFSEINYWPRGLYFRLNSHKNFMLKLQEYVNKGRCLDLGCKTTRYKPFIEAHGLEWYGADIIDFDAKESNYKKIINNHLDFDNSFFDVICAFNVIEHFTQPELMFSEIARCLKEGGIFSGACAFWEMEHESFFHFTDKGLSEILKRHGFELIYLKPSEYSGLVLAAQRFFSGVDYQPYSVIEKIRDKIIRNLNWIPFITINLLELIRKTLFRKRYNPLKDAATLYFYARKRDN